MSLFASDFASALVQQDGPDHRYRLAQLSEPSQRVASGYIGHLGDDETDLSMNRFLKTQS